MEACGFKYGKESMICPIQLDRFDLIYLQCHSVGSVIRHNVLESMNFEYPQLSQTPLLFYGSLAY